MIEYIDNRSTILYNDRISFIQLKKTLMSKILKIVTFVPRKLLNYTKAINTALEAPLGISEKFSALEAYTTKLFGATTGSCGLGKGAADAAEALACKDGVCFFVSCVGCTADTLQIIACWVPGPNITTVVTMPLSWGCKTFVWACKNKTLPWKTGC